MKKPPASSKRPAKPKAGVVKAVKAAKKAPAKKPATRKTAPRKSSSKNSNGNWILRLYVAGQTPKSLTAVANLKRLCEEHLLEGYEIEIIDLSKQPHLAASDQIVALPTLVRRLPAPIKRVVGDLSNTSRVVIGMDLIASAS